MAGNGPDVHCPNCGAQAERGQLVCLECGGRIGLVYRRPPSWKVPAAILVVVALLLAGGAVLAVSALSSEADREVAAAPPRPREAAKPASSPGNARPSAAPALAKRGDLYSWPGSLEGFTVVINSTEDRASADKFARAAAKAAKVGVLRAADFRTLPKGFYVVFAGHYASRAEADRATGRLNRKYRGAFTQSVQR
jgi:septal ring-binding cell division protein DamX